MGRKTFMSALIAGCGLITAAYGNEIVFTDKTTFVSASGATSATGPLPNIGLVGGPGSTQTVGNVTFSITAPSSALFIGVGSDPNCLGVIGCDWTIRLPGPDIAISDVENLNADLASAVFGLGFDFVKPVNDPAYATVFPSTFTVTLLNNGSSVFSFTYDTPTAAVPGDTAAFVGVWGDQAFNRVEIRETVGGIDDEYLGQFYTSDTAVPEPASLILLGSGLFGLAMKVRGKSR